MCVCVLFLLLCPRLNVRLQMCVDELLFYDKVLSKKWGGRPFEKKVTQNENFKKKTSNNQQPLQINTHTNHHHHQSMYMDILKR